MRLIVGLGNPGAAYAHTRHNIGIWVLERAAARWSIRLRRHGIAVRGAGAVGSESVELAGHLDWMNVTGPPLKALLHELGLSPEQLIVIHDDLDLELGRLRIRQAGGHGGHNGLRSILAALDTPNFVRLKIGIGRPAPGQEAADYVLEPFSRDERTRIEPVLDRAVRALECIVLKGVGAAMNEFNVREREDANEE
ncbi:MAG: peptidyl-tRNA hydrolase [Nitrospiraceae bacterium]|nr:MAG: peptidyl-tRNA hydrolase [Nitrospiraceae bacterium]